MAITAQTVEERITTQRREDLARLAARSPQYTIERESGGWIVRNPRIPGRVELVTDAGACTCRRYGVWGRCRHVALVEARGGHAGTN